MTQVVDEVLGKIARQQHDLFRRVKEGTLDSVAVSRGLQDLIEGRFAGVVSVPPTERFVAREKFVVNTGRKAPVEISYVGGNFSKWFLGKIEEPKPETQLRYAKLFKLSEDSPILAGLGNTAETTLAEVYALMERQPNGEEGVLLTSGYANIFYVRDVNSELRAVHVHWHGGGWCVNARSVERRLAWRVGYCIFSRNS
jgi:hypothetical protein